MPAGSGPQVALATGFAMPAATTETAVLSTPLGSWQETLGQLLSASVYVTGSATGTITFRIRQGVGTGGTLVGVAQVLTGVAAATTQTFTAQVADTSAFALSGQLQQYTLTAQGSVNSVGTLTYVLFEQETIAPIQ